MLALYHINSDLSRGRDAVPAPCKGSALDPPEALPLDSGKGHSPLQPNSRAYSVQKTYSACAQRYIRVWLPEHTVGGDAHIAPLIYLTFPIRRGAFRAPAPFHPRHFNHIAGTFLFADDFVFHGAMWASPPTAGCPRRQSTLPLVTSLTLFKRHNLLSLAGT